MFESRLSLDKSVMTGP